MNAVWHAALATDIYRPGSETSICSRPAAALKLRVEPGTDSTFWSGGEAEHGDDDTDGPRVGQKYQATMPALQSRAGA